MAKRHIIIQNRLEVLPGNKLLVPGCEPTSELTSTSLAENRECAATIVDLNLALEAISGSTIVSWYNPRRLFFVLPDGPPTKHGCLDPNTDKCIDYYQILRDIGEQEQPPVNNVDKCESFMFKSCS